MTSANEQAAQLVRNTLMIYSLKVDKNLLNDRHTQTLGTRPLSLLPNSLGTRLVMLQQN